MIWWFGLLLIGALLCFLGLIRLYVNQDAMGRPWDAAIFTIIMAFCIILFAMSVDQYNRGNKFIDKYEKVEIGVNWIDRIDPSYENAILSQVLEINNTLANYKRKSWMPCYSEKLRNLDYITLQTIDIASINEGP